MFNKKNNKVLLTNDEGESIWSDEVLSAGVYHMGAYFIKFATNKGLFHYKTFYDEWDARGEMDYLRKYVYIESENY